MMEYIPLKNLHPFSFPQEFSTEYLFIYLFFKNHILVDRPTIVIIYKKFLAPNCR
jgi:hypothetical protein